MLRSLRVSSPRSVRLAQRHDGPNQRILPWRRLITDYASKYSEKLEKVAQEQGVSVEALRTRIKEKEREALRQRAIEAEARAAERAKEQAAQSASASSSAGPRPVGASVRTDSSPVKPLSSILNTERLMSTPHTAKQVSALWTAYHASRSGGTGRGFICATLPRATYESMLSTAQRYPQFVIPVPRAAPASEAPGADKAYEFHLLQWSFYDAPPVPSAAPPDPFARPAAAATADTPNPRTTTAIFAPLLEYKLRQTFATPYLALTFYPELAASHGVVLLRGEITPAGQGAGTGDYLLSQQDAQILALGLQRFYLRGASEEREKLLSAFHERPADFKWEELLKHADFGL
ncbi:ATP11 protein-domain-containing protein [Gloeopeniophorella convolvens]|nr:ATP11 protein-domain-containing protein [Gloeopeniophorella convolvens]